MSRSGYKNAQFFPNVGWVQGEPLILRLSVDASFFLKELCILMAYSPPMCGRESEAGVTDRTFLSTNGLLQDMSMAEPH
jgi:hypothetical protein